MLDLTSLRIVVWRIISEIRFITETKISFHSYGPNCLIRRNGSQKEGVSLTIIVNSTKVGIIFPLFLFLKLYGLEIGIPSYMGRGLFELWHCWLSLFISSLENVENFTVTVIILKHSCIIQMWENCLTHHYLFYLAIFKGACLTFHW